MAIVHAQLSEFHPVVGAHGRAHRRSTQPFAFETIYGHYFDRVIANDAKTVLETSVARYVAAVEGKRGYE